PPTGRTSDPGSRSTSRRSPERAEARSLRFPNVFGGGPGWIPSMDELDEIRAKKLAELQTYAETQALKKSTKPVHLTDANFASETSQVGVALVDLWAAWCGPCLRIAPVIEQLASDYAGKMKVGKLNTDENPWTTGRFGVESIPTLLIFKDGDLVDRIICAVPRQEIERVLGWWI